MFVLILLSSQFYSLISTHFGTNPGAFSYDFKCLMSDEQLLNNKLSSQEHPIRSLIIRRMELDIQVIKYIYKRIFFKIFPGKRIVLF